MLSGAQFPIPPFQWPQVGRQWPAWNIESDQADGLVLWMPWGGGTVPGAHSHVDQISGLVFTKGGTPIWVADSERGWSLSFDSGSSEYLIHSSAPVTAPPLTVACRFYHDSDAVAHFNLIDIASAAAANRHRLYIQFADDIRAESRLGGSAAEAITTADRTINTWQHACGVWADVDSRAAYLEGGNKGTNATDVQPTGLDTTGIGARVGLATGDYFSGRITDTRIYNVAKNDAQVAELVHPDTKWELYEIPRRLWRLGVVAPPPSAIIPIAMHHYRSRRVN